MNATNWTVPHGGTTVGELFDLAVNSVALNRECTAEIKREFHKYGQPDAEERERKTSLKYRADDAFYLLTPYDIERIIAAIWVKSA